MLELLTQMGSDELIIGGLTLTTIISILYALYQRRDKILAQIEAGNYLGALQSTIECFDYNNTTVMKATPEILSAEQSGSCLFTMQQTEKDKIIYGLSDTESKVILMEIKDHERDGDLFYTIDTSKGTYTISSGYIDVDPTINRGVRPARNYDGLIIGDVKLKEITSGLSEIYSGIILSQDEYIGKPMSVGFTPLSQGTIVIGCFWDDIQLGTQHFDISPEEIDESRVNYATFRFPQYKTSTIGNEFSKGTHQLTLAEGFISTYDNGDKIIWNDKEQITIVVD